MCPKKRRRRKKKTSRRPLLYIALPLLLCGAILYFFSGPSSYRGEVPSDPEAYFEALAPYGIYVGERYDVWPSVTLAQSALESDYGRSGLSKTYNNYFGIKELRPNKGVSLFTQEVFDGEETTIKDRFRTYNNVAESFADYGKMLSSMDQYHGVLEAKTYSEAAYALQAGGYATDPYYPAKIISLIETYGLDRYDKGIKP